MMFNVGGIRRVGRGATQTDRRGGGEGQGFSRACKKKEGKGRDDAVVADRASRRFE